MMRGAPEMRPSLDEALRAMGGSVPPGLGVVDQFLAQLDELRECPAVVLDQDQAAALEGAYLAGFRCADESGHVLVVSLPALLAYVGHGAPAAPTPRWPWLAKGVQLLGAGPLAAALVFGVSALVALLADKDHVAAGLLLGAGVLAALVGFVHKLPPTACTHDCDEGRACTCQPLRTVPAAVAPPSSCSFPECVCSFERMVAGCQSHQKNLTGEKQHAG
jgi:hypothetical protein